MKTSTLPKATELPKTFDELVRMFPPRAIHDEMDYENMRELIERLVLIPKPTKGQDEYLDTICVLFSAYEQEHYPIETDPVTMLKACMRGQDQEMTQSELAALLGVSKSAVSLILSGKRNLTASHARKLANYFKVSTDLFIA